MCARVSVLNCPRATEEVHTMSRHHTYYVTSSYILCHIIIRVELSSRDRRLSFGVGTERESERERDKEIERAREDAGCMQ